MYYTVLSRRLLVLLGGNGQEMCWDDSGGDRRCCTVHIWLRAYVRMQAYLAACVRPNASIFVLLRMCVHVTVFATDLIVVQLC